MLSRAFCVTDLDKYAIHGPAIYERFVPTKSYSGRRINLAKCLTRDEKLQSGQVSWTLTALVKGF